MNNEVLLGVRVRSRVQLMANTCELHSVSNAGSASRANAHF